MKVRPAGRSIARGFGRAAPYYEEHAHVQRVAADRLIGLFGGLAPDLPAGRVLEVGCGTGFLSRELARRYPDRDLEITDLSQEMVAFTRERAIPRGAGAMSGRAGAISFRAADAERLDPATAYAAIVAGFVAQWFEEPGPGLVRVAECLAPGGSLVASIPVTGTFPEWKLAADRIGVPFHAADLPGALAILTALEAAGLEVDSTEEEFAESHASPIEFFRHLKRIGAATRLGGEPLAPRAFASLLGAWEATSNGTTTVSYRVLFLSARRPDRT